MRALAVLGLAALLASCGGLPRVSGVETARLAYAPEVPPPITRDHATTVKVELEVKEARGRLADAVDYVFWTFGGTVPGPMIRVREGDRVEFTLKNHPGSKMPHNIDLHAVQGPGGGATASLTAPGHASTFSFRVLNPGLYVYHCATAPVPIHVANGMYGLIYVEPKGGLPKVDREFQVVQGEFYTKGRFGDPGLQDFDMQKALDEKPEYVVFNGAVGSMTGERAPKIKVGEKVRLFVGNGGPNLVSSFHVIGTVFDKVYTEGGTLANQENVQSTLVPAGGSAIVEFKAWVPGNYLIVDHSIFRPFNKGALAMIKAEGAPDKDVYSGKIKDETWVPQGETNRLLQNASLDVKAFGSGVYKASCMGCHGDQGQGLPGVIPPLAKADFLVNRRNEAIHAVIRGMNGHVVVNGVGYSNAMPELGLSDPQVQAVLNYVMSSWGNAGRPVTADEVLHARDY